MKRLKTTVLAGVLGVVMTVPVFANESPSRVAPLPQFSAADAELIFEADATKPMQLAALSQQEMVETEGAFLPWVIRGGVMGSIGGVGNALNSYNNGNRGWSVVRAGGIGFAVGATGGIASRWLGNRRW